MSRAKILISIMLLLLLTLVLGIYFKPQAASANCNQAKRLSPDSSAADLGDAGINFACREFELVETPKVVLSRPLLPSDLSAFQLYPSEICSYDYLGLVVLKGKFHYTNNLHQTDLNYQYVAYIFDKQEGIDIGMVASPNGARLRELLNDPNLPDNSIEGSPETPTVVPKKAILESPKSKNSKKRCSENSVQPTRAPNN